MDENSVVVVGLISDTHGVVADAALQALKRATHTIKHAGDVGDKKHKSRLSAKQVIDRLKCGTNKSIIAVSGNVDESFVDLPDSSTVTINGKKILVEHICGFPPKKELEEKVNARAIDVVVFGHSHVPGVWWHNNVLYVNPGSAGPRRFKLPRCIAFLVIHSTGDIEVDFTPVDTRLQDTSGLPLPFNVSSKVEKSLHERKEENCNRKRQKS